MYRIGEFSILNDITIKTLRYYDKINLFKPAIVDKYTGYRYYSDKQLSDFIKILRYKDLGFSLDEIKDLIIEKNKQSLIRNKINDLTQEIIEKEKNISYLKNILGENNMRVEYKPYKKYLIIGKRYTINNRKDINKKLEEVKQKLIKLNIPYQDKVFCNFELGYIENDIDCLIGYTITNDDEIRKIDIKDLEIIGKSPVIKQLVGNAKKEELNELYKDMIIYAHDNNIQIRGFFTEIYKNNYIEIYVEAFDLNEENNDYIKYLSHYKPITEIDKELIGTYKIREILPDLKYMANPKKQKSSLDTKYKKLKLNSDGTTNYENIKWNKNELVLTIEDTLIPLKISKIHYNKKLYIEILMNESYEYHKSQRPIEYLYEKI